MRHLESGASVFHTMFNHKESIKLVSKDQVGSLSLLRWYKIIIFHNLKVLLLPDVDVIMAQLVGVFTQLLTFIAC